MNFHIKERNRMGCEKNKKNKSIPTKEKNLSLKIIYFYILLSGIWMVIFNKPKTNEGRIYLVLGGVVLYILIYENIFQKIKKKLLKVKDRKKTMLEEKKWRKIKEENPVYEYEVPIKKLKEFIHPQEYKAIFQKLNTYISKNTSTFQVEFRIENNEENYKWFLARGEAKWNKKDNVVHVIGTHIDITKIKNIEKQLKESQEIYTSLYEHNHLPIFIMDTINGNIVDANIQACSFYGYSKEEFKKLKITNLNVLSLEDIMKALEEAMVKKRNYFYFQHKLKNNEIKDVEVYSGCIKIEEKQYVYSIVKDITEKKRNEERLNLFGKLLENNTEGILITDKKGIVKWSNPAFASITGYDKEEILDKNPSILQSGKQDEEFYKDMWKQIKKEERWKGELWNKHKNGRMYLQTLNIFAIKDNENEITHYAGIITDITENKYKEEEINYLAFRDSLTGLYNRAFFMEKLNMELNKSTEDKEMLGVIFMDLDGFKKVNDNLGHIAGDRLLQGVAKRLKEYMRNKDVIARIGGDEFTILISKIKNRESIVEIAQRVLDIFKYPYNIDGCNLYISASIGIAIYPQDGVNSDILLKNADIAMYSAKESGKNKFEFYSQDLNEKIKEEFVLENSLRYALDRNEFFIHYQPIVDINTEKIIGAEALLRWKSPGLGFVPPDKFIAIAERNNFILSIGEWILRNACIQNKKWQDSGFSPIFISVNISVNQLKEKDFVEKVADILEETKLDPKYLDLEITESISMENIHYIRDVLNKLKKLNVNVSMDDFGTGYSSLGGLKNLYITKLKIDKCFIKDINIDENNTAIVSAIIAMAKNLNLRIVAEGVETREQLTFLKKYGCDMFQGYLISPPIDEQSFKKLL